MDAERVIELFDLYWLHRQIITTSPPPPPPPPPPPTPNLEISKDSPKPELSRAQSRHVRSLSDQLTSQTSFTSDSSSPKSVLADYKLQTILSGKEPIEEQPTKNLQEPIPKDEKKQRRRRKSSTSRSLSELEFEELKGFMDLGFVFSEEDKNSSLVSILPGLQRLGNDDKEVKMVSRPYLSEAWEVMNRRRKIENQFLMMNWRFPSLSNEIDMKHNLRSWAHNVASAVRV